MIGFRHVDRRFPFLWEDAGQPPGRWHGEGEGPVHYFADTPDGAWAEFLRHEGITTPEDLTTVERAIWAVELPERQYAEPNLPLEALTGGFESYAACRAEARRLRSRGVAGLRAPSAALEPGTAGGWRVEGWLTPADSRDGVAFAVFGPRTDLVGWHAAEGRPAAALLPAVRHFATTETATDNR